MEQEVNQESSRKFGWSRFKFMRWRRWLWSGLLVFIAVLLVFNTFNLATPRPDKNKWQAVFLTNGQVYFGRLEILSKDYVKLSSIYYLQVQQPVQPQPQTAQPNINLVKLGGELHGPEDEMFIPQDRILFWENLRDDSQVVRVIGQSQ